MLPFGTPSACSISELNPLPSYRLTLPCLQKLSRSLGLDTGGLPVAVAFGQHRPVIAFDINTTRLAELHQGHDRTGEVSTQELRQANLTFTDNPEDLR